MSRWFGVGGQGWKPKDIILSDDTADLQWTNLVKGGNAKNLGELRGVIKLGANCTVTEVTETVLPEDVSDFLQTKDMKFYVIKLMREGEKVRVQTGIIHIRGQGMKRVNGREHHNSLPQSLLLSSFPVFHSQTNSYSNFLSLPLSLASHCYYTLTGLRCGLCRQADDRQPQRADHVQHREVHICQEVDK